MGGVCSGRPASMKGSNKQKGQPKKLNKFDDSHKVQAKFSNHSKPVMLRMPQGKGVSKNMEESPVFGRSRTLNLKKAKEIFEKSVSSFKSRKESVHGGGNKISILSFEVANIIGKGRNLLESLSEKKIGILKEVLSSEGVQNLVSTDMNLLMMIAAADTREEFNVFVKEVIRFGDLCKDPQWHNLGVKLDSDYFIRNISKEEAEATMRELRVLARHTAELYHELNALDRLEHDYKQKREEVNSFLLPLKGDDLEMLNNEVKLQRKFVKSLKKKSLWFKNVEEIVEKLLNIAAYLNQRIIEVSKNNGTTLHEEEAEKYRTSQRLGLAGLALHYANVIVQINTIASNPAGLPPKVRDSLYRSLPDGVKTALRTRLQVAGELDEQLSISSIKAEMDKTSKWLVPASSNTIKVHQKFGWVGEWAMSSKDKKKTDEIIRLQTLYHADKAKTEMYILEQVTRLHYLIKLVKQRVNHAIPHLPRRSLIKRNPNLPPKVHKVPPVTNTTPKPMNHNKLSRVCPLSQNPKAHQPARKVNIAVGQFKF